MAIQVGRRIVFEKLTGKVICDFGEMQGDVLPREALGELDFVDLEYGQNSDSFSRVVKYHIDPETKKVIFDELREPVLTPEQQVEELQNKLMIAEGVI